MKRYLSLGAGVQSSTILLLSERGLLPRVDAAIFADTGWESPATYRWMEWLKEQTTIPISVVKAKTGTARDHALGTVKGRGDRFATIPFFIRNPDGSMAKGMRQCTKELKIEPIQAEVRRLSGLGHGERAPKDLRVEQWIGISLDEVVRMKPSRVPWVTHVWPLIDLLSPPWRRADCLRWWREQCLPVPPRSSCVGCPYHSDDEWRELREKQPEAFADAVEVDRLLRDPAHKENVIRFAGGFRGERYLHRSLKPLAMVDLRSEEDRGQMTLWGEECEGMCGV